MPAVVFRGSGASSLRVVWSDYMKADLRRHCAVAEYDITQIARLMGLSRGSIRGMIERLDIKRPERPVAAKPAVERKPRVRSEPMIAAVPIAILASSGPIPPPRCCQYPIGDPRKKGFRFCSGPLAELSPYCETHTTTSYVQRRQRIEWEDAE